MKDKQLKKELEKGKILTKVTFEMQGRPKKHIETTIKQYINKIKEDKELQILEEHIEKATELEEPKNVFSSFAEVDILFNNLEKITWLCINFMPASIELLEPEKFEFNSNNLQNWLNDVLSKLHQVDMVAKRVNDLNQVMNKNINTILKNFIMLLVKNKIPEDKMTQLIGIDIKTLKKYLTLLEKKPINKNKGGNTIESKK